MGDLAIRAEKLGKSYRLSHEQPGRMLREDLVSLLKTPLRRVLGRSRRPLETFWALKDVSFEVKRGAVVGIIGRNGAGKSTLLKLLSRITAPTTGSAELHGRTGSLLEVGTGFHPELTGRENIFLNGAILGMRQGEIRAKFDEIVAFAEVERFLDTPVKRYSSGMYVRLAFAVAAHLEPEILIIDEVLAVGDVQFQKKCLGKMETVARDGRTVLFVSHNITAVRRLCPETILLENGQVVASGTTGRVLEKYMKDTLSGGSAAYSQPADRTKPIHLRNVRLVVPGRTGASAEAPTIDSGFSVEIDYDVHEPVRDCIVWLAIRTLDDTVVFATADYDMDPARLGTRERGGWRTTVAVPPRWLNAGSYYIVVGITGQSPVFSFDRVNAVYFNVVDTGVYALPEGAERGGLLKPALRWETVARAEVAA